MNYANDPQDPAVSSADNLLDDLMAAGSEQPAARSGGQSNRPSSDRGAVPPSEPTAGSNGSGGRNDGMAAAGADQGGEAGRGGGADQAGQATALLAGQAVDVAAMGVFDWGVAPHEPYDIAVRLSRGSQPGGWAARLEWPELASPGVVVYRVIFADGEPAASDCNEVEPTLVVRTAAYARDDTAVNPATAGARFYEVWAYQGPTVEAAVAAAPYLYALGKVIWPPLDLVVTPDQDRLSATWRAMPGVRYRWLRQGRQEARRVRPSPDGATDATGGGFVDRHALPGVSYVYSVYSGVDFDGNTEWSDEPSRTPAEIPIQLEPVMDLRVERNPGDPGCIDLSWSPPVAGDVRIFRLDQAPASDVHRAGEVASSALTSVEIGLAPLDQTLPYHHQVDPQDGLAHMREVTLPTGQAECYFTPVTVHPNGKLCVPGRPVILLNPLPPGNPFLEDRVDWVLVAFVWPSGASKVNLYWARPDVSVDPEHARPLAVVIEKEAKSFGGFQVDRRLIPPGPCQLVLVGQKEHDSGVTAFSEPVVLKHTFPALLRYRYQAQPVRLRGKRLMLALSSREGARDVGLALVLSTFGLPLTLDDGQVLARWRQDIPDDAHPAAPIDVSRDLLGGRPVPHQGYLRLMADPQCLVGVQDPAPAELNMAVVLQ